MMEAGRGFLLGDEAKTRNPLLAVRLERTKIFEDIVDTVWPTARFSRFEATFLCERIA